MNKILHILLLFVGSAAMAQETPPDTIKTSYLDEVVISANKIPEQRRSVAQQIKIISPAVLLNFNAQTSADLLQNTGVVAMQRSQQGGGSPILRGFEASRVLLMIDGVRLNNLIYRGGHLQNVITMDNNIVDRAEVLFGPSSTVYGSDALGGVVHFYTRNPELNKKLSGNAFSRLGTANKEKTFHVDVNSGGEKFASLTSFTFSDFEDLRMGKKINPALGEEFGLRKFYARRLPDNSGDELVANSDPYIQKGSGYTQYDFLQKFLFAQNERVQHILNFQFSTSSDIPRYDRLTDNKTPGGPLSENLANAVWYYGPQKRLVSSYQIRINGLGAFADGLTATASYQSIEESRHNRGFGSANLNHRIETVNVIGLTIDLNKALGKNRLQYGFDSQFNTLTSTAHRVNISTGVQTPLSTRYPNGDNAMNFMAVYLTHINELTDKLTLTYGGRIGTSHLQSTFVNDGAFKDLPFSEANQFNITSSVTSSIIYRPDATWKLAFSANSGFRAPNVDDLAKIFDPAAGSVVVPNKNLSPEKTVNLELGITKQFLFGMSWENNFYITQFTDIIVTDRFTFNGQDSILYDGVLSRVTANQNKGKANVTGLSSIIRREMANGISFSASYNLTRGRIKTDTTDTPLDHIAPAFGRISVGYSNSKLRSELFANFSAKKSKDDYSLSGEDNAQYAPADGMPAWWTLNLRASYDLNKWITLQAGIDNILDLQYRTFASGINSPGRNFFGTLRVKF
jgi:hemoglobin/transferrin/lactoferrin receptor protein